MLKGTILISPEDKNNFFAFFVKSQIVDNRPSKQDDSIADERLIMICQNNSGEFSITSPAKFIDLHPPTQFTKPIETPLVINQEEVVHWSFNHITLQQFEDTKNLVEKDSADRKSYLETAFTQVILDVQAQIQELQTKLMLGDTKASEKIQKKEENLRELILKKQND
jgi:hypothetical protein